MSTLSKTLFPLRRSPSRKSSQKLCPRKPVSIAVEAAWDQEGGVWVAPSDDVPGLVAHSAYFAALESYMSAQHAPTEARAIVAFLEGLAQWDFGKAWRASEVLVPLAVKGDHWMPVDELREGAVLARLQLGDVAGARRVLQALAPQSARDANDVRPQLLEAWISAKGAEQRMSSRDRTIGR